MSNQTVEIRLPRIDENVVEYKISRWLKKEGDAVVENEPICEVDTDKVTMEVVAEASGQLIALLAAEGDVLKPGDLLARLRPLLEPATATPSQPLPKSDPQPKPLLTIEEPPMVDKRLSPVVSRMVAEHGLDVSMIKGTGRNGRVTKKDVLAWLKEESVEKKEEKKEQITNNGQPLNGNDHLPSTTHHQPLTGMRRSIAEHMVRSLATSPHVTTMFEFDFHRVAAHRQAHKSAFAADGVKLTYMAYLALATVQALQKFPLVNSRFHKDSIELIKEINLGMIVAVPDGLYAPVIHHADEYNLKGLARAIGDLSQRAHSGQLRPADLQGGTFTISNHGSAGSIAGTPIIFQPQAGILGIGAIEKRVKVIADSHGEGIHIRPCAYISFSFDHRVMDGAVSDGFCSEIKRIIENWP